MKLSTGGKMKLVSVLNIGLLTILTSTSLYAAELGQLTLGGDGCTVATGAQDLIPISGKPGRYQIPAQVAAAKKNAPSLLRNSCNFSLPVQVNKHEKLQVLDVTQAVNLKASKGTTVKTSLEIFLAGQVGNPLTAEAKGVSGTAKVSQTLRADGVVAESECGADSIIRGNLNAVILGSAKGTALTSRLQLTIRTVSCQ